MNKLNVGIVLDLKEIDGTFKYVINTNYISSIINGKPKDLDLRIIKITYEDNPSLLDLDGVVLIGGGKYSKDVKEKPSLYEANPKRYNFEKNIIKHCFDKKIPLLGICRGFQMINETFDGSVDYINKKTDINHASRKAKHEVKILDGTTLKKIYGKSKLNVNSFHLKEITRVSNKFKVSGISQDGIIEAIESNFSPFFLGVQWHPNALKNKDSDSLFDYFLNYCSKNKKRIQS